MAEHVAVRGGGAAIAHGMERDAIGRRARDQLVGDARRKRLIHQRAFALGRLVAFHATLGVVGGLALDHAYRDAADAAVALVQERHVILVAVRERNTARRVGPVR
jgi:hypothetical protein